MGNCVFKGFHHHGVLEDMMVRVVTSNGGVMELYTPITVDCITNEFPGHGIFRTHRNIFSEPLPKNEELQGGKVGNKPGKTVGDFVTGVTDGGVDRQRQDGGQVRQWGAVVGG
ncbi:hypothetical protein SESBI_23646 [Sesbania bispinosa]|nr:hypothetical protein SESBI_23646 [Sesbania bispinosa]